MPPRSAVLKTKPARPSPKKEQLLATAEDLFDRYGFFGTGVDRVIAESGVARMTLYKHYPTKGALVRAVLERRDARLWRVVEEEAGRLAAAGAHPLLSLFDGLALWLEKHAGQGCLLLRALGEYSSHDVAVAGDAAFRKKKTAAVFTRHLQALGVTDAEARGAQLALLFEGAMATAPVDGASPAALTARRAAETLLWAWEAMD